MRDVYYQYARNHHPGDTMTAFTRIARRYAGGLGITPSVTDDTGSVITPTPNRFSDVRVWDFKTAKWLHVGTPLTTITGLLYPMLDDDGANVALLYDFMVEEIIERSSELAGLDVA